MNIPSPNLISKLKAQLHKLYADGSKHAIYQNVPEFVREALGYNETINENWRSDRPRYQYLLNRLALPAHASVADVGANTGYFSLNMARTRPTHPVHVFEPNPNHRAFIKEIATAFQLPNLHIHESGWTAGNLTHVGHFDTVLLLNILHHAGFDFDQDIADDNEAFTNYATKYLAQLRVVCRQLCFQVGSNRGGDKRRPLFPYEDDVNRFEWSLQLLASSGWKIRHAGVAGRDVSGTIGYSDIPAELLETRGHRATPPSAIAEYFTRANLAQFPGEFYRRPLFICEAS